MVGEATVKLAVLIDADNAQPSRIEPLLAEVAKYGTAFVKRAYGDWTGTGLNPWKEHLLRQSIQPIQQFAYTQGKNATDSAMIIDAMDLLYSDRFDGFCLVSSDSDFTRLAARLRESGRVVYGFGHQKTPKPFVAACDKFVYVENLVYNEEPPAVPTPAPDGDEAGAAPAPKRRAVEPAAPQTELVRVLRNAVQALSMDDGWSSLAAVGFFITKQQPDFDPRTFGYAKLSELIIATGLFEVEQRTPGAGKPPVMYVRDKQA
ncbi:NYN and OST-HTH/LOTUS domain protein [Pleurostoma richardsiae]|uniref:NYN and OST-HTH/LOTUS domain protein n=1 Tax=Pleurostoma richardsiae TaxID=41990 RepID=A0AA38R985_9PEZI|nr:NYN and OST-HTH/LOTUS domain protein [Pleurostoma richardsiae]